MVRSAADETTTRDGRPLAQSYAQAGTSYVADGPASYAEELAVAALARPSGRDGVMASPPPRRRWWLLEGAGAAFQHVLTASTACTMLHTDHGHVSSIDV
jgi:hypothetical protein